MMARTASDAGGGLRDNGGMRSRGGSRGSGEDGGGLRDNARCNVSVSSCVFSGRPGPPPARRRAVTAATIS